MAFRGAIALTKGFKVRKIQEEKKKEKVDKWKRTFKR